MLYHGYGPCCTRSGAGTARSQSRRFQKIRRYKNLPPTSDGCNLFGHKNGRPAGAPSKSGEENFRRVKIIPRGRVKTDRATSVHAGRASAFIAASRARIRTSAHLLGMDRRLRERVRLARAMERVAAGDFGPPHLADSTKLAGKAASKVGLKSKKAVHSKPPPMAHNAFGRTV